MRDDREAGAITTEPAEAKAGAGPAVTPPAPKSSRGRQKGSPKRSPLNADQQNLARKYVPLARSLSKGLKKAWPLEKDEFESAAMYALVEAAESFDPSRNVKFATFARYRIWGALRDVQRGLVTSGFKCDTESAPQVSGMTYDTEEKGRVIGAEPAPPVGEEMEAIDFVDTWLRKLPPRHASACREIYLNGKSQCEAADLLGCSKSRLSYLHQEALMILNDAWDYHVKKNPNVAAPVPAGVGGTVA